MTITRKIEKNEKEEQRKREEFILKGGSVTSDKKEKKEFTNILVRLPTSMVKAIDQLIESKLWMTRTQWIAETINERLETEMTDQEYELAKQ